MTDEFMSGAVFGIALATIVIVVFSAAAAIGARYGRAR